ncbi:MAG: glycosyltransferase, partial [Myxococcota bacterium]
MYLSVIIPVLNEAERIDACLRRLADQPGLGECIVVDGGSADDTAARAARHHRVQVVHSRRGRAVQLNTGAAAARGDTLLFLHADTELPDNAAVTVAATLARPGVVAGGFRTWHRAERWRGKRRAALLHLADIRSRYSSLLYGDQAMFMTADIFRQVGGFPDLDLME